MATVPANAQPGQVACPDPSVHDHPSKLSSQASTAALYATDPARDSSSSSHARENPLGPDGKLSSRSAATSLKHARAQDLPSFPTSGNAAGSAGKAALLANDYKMKELWHPELSSAGSKAALIAHRDGGKLDLWMPSASKEGNSAAVLAMRAKGLSPELDRGYTQDGRSKALQAATLSVNRGRSGSTPIQPPPAYPDSHNSAYNALNAATASHRAQSIKAAPDGWSSEANQAARVKNLHVNPKYFGENPGIDIDPDETKHQAALRASAVSMAKQMYDHQNRTVLGPDLTGGIEGASSASARQSTTQPADLKAEAMRYIHLQDAAHKLAQERLAKVDKEHENAKYREYYGYPDQQASPRKSMNRLSMRGRTRRRASSEADLNDDSDDEQQARRIRSQMTQLNSGLSSVDEKKRSDDRARLIAAAEKKVHAQMHDMDERVFSDTGKIPPAMQEELEAKARKRAEDQRELADRPENRGKTHIGGGKFIDQGEIDAIAAARLKPTLDEINETAEKKRARDQELREEREEQERIKQEDKQKRREEKEEKQRIKDEEKAVARQEKLDMQTRKSEDQRKGRETFGASVADEAAMEENRRRAEEPQRRSGMLGRFSNKFRGSKKADESPVVATEAKDTSAAGSATGAAAVGDIAGSDSTEDVHDDVEKEREIADEDAQLEKVHSGDHTDAGLNPTSATKPDLERHISTLGHSDDDLDDSDEDDESDLDNESEQVHKMAALHEGQVTATGTGEPIEGEQYESGKVRTDGHPMHTTGPHPTDTANILDPHVEAQPEVMRDVEDVEPIVATKVEPIAATETTEKSGDATGPAPNTIGPHSSDAANIVDPKVKPDPEKLGKQKEITPATATKIDSAPTPKVQDEPSEKQQKGLRGFFGKLKSRSSRSETDPQRLQKSTKDEPAKTSIDSSKSSVDSKRLQKTAPATTARTSEAETPAASQVSSATKEPVTSTEPGTASPSSFQRGEGDALRNVSDISSSGADEEDLTRGRKGMNSIDSTGERDDEDHFEEARDHFDENLAPPPAFAGQSKNESPHRETKFREEV